MTQGGLVALDPEDAIKLLHVAQNLCVCVFAPGQREEDGPSIETWPRVEVEATLRRHGALLSGPNAREANFGVCARTRPDTYAFFETAHA